MAAVGALAWSWCCLLPGLLQPFANTFGNGFVYSAAQLQAGEQRGDVFFQVYIEHNWLAVADVRVVAFQAQAKREFALFIVVYRAAEHRIMKVLQSAGYGFYRAAAAKHGLQLVRRQFERATGAEGRDAALLYFDSGTGDFQGDRAAEQAGAFEALSGVYLQQAGKGDFVGINGDSNRLVCQVDGTRGDAQAAIQEFGSRLLDAELAGERLCLSSPVIRQQAYGAYADAGVDLADGCVPKAGGELIVFKAEQQVAAEVGDGGSVHQATEVPEIHAAVHGHGGVGLQVNGHLGAEFAAAEFQQVQLLRPVGEGISEDADGLAAGHGGAQPDALEFAGYVAHADIRFQPRLVTDLPIQLHIRQRTPNPPGKQPPLRLQRRMTDILQPEPDLLHLKLQRTRRPRHQQPKNHHQRPDQGSVPTRTDPSRHKFCTEGLTPPDLGSVPTWTVPSRHQVQA